MKREEFGYDTFLSPFTWRYGSPEMRRVFSEENYRALWRRIWVSLAEAQGDYGLVSSQEVEDLKSKMGPEHLDLARAHEIEERIGHDLMAEIRAYAEQCPTGGGKIHLGATSADIEDNADILRMRKALNIILTRLVSCLHSTSENIKKYRDLPCIGWTHLQPAEPTTLGYRFANYGQDLVLDIQNIERLLEGFVKGKGIKGAVGTSASFLKLMEGRGKPFDLEKKVMQKLLLEAFPVSTQTYPRKLDYLVLSALAGIAQSTHKFGFDVRLLQSPVYSEMAEPAKEEQVGSSTMPFKRNPIIAERICSLARYVSVLPLVAFMNAANTLLERTLDDSANRRAIIPEGFLATDECLILYDKIMRGIRVYHAMVKRNLERFGPFTGTEAILVRLTERGEDRQEVHERLRGHSFKAWEAVMGGRENPLPDMLKSDPIVKSRLSHDEISRLLEPSGYVGDAPERCDSFLSEVVSPILSKYKDRQG